MPYLSPNLSDMHMYIYTIRIGNKSKSNFAASWLNILGSFWYFGLNQSEGEFEDGKCLWPHWHVACLINVFADLAVDL